MLNQISCASIVALDEFWDSTGPGQDKVNLIDTIEDTDAPDPSRAYRVQAIKETLAGGHRAAAGAGADRHRPLLLRGPDSQGDRRGAGGHRVAGLPAPHQGGPAPAGAHQGGPRPGGSRPVARQAALRRRRCAPQPRAMRSASTDGSDFLVVNCSGYAIKPGDAPRRWCRVTGSDAALRGFANKTIVRYACPQHQ